MEEKKWRTEKSEKKYISFWQSMVQIVYMTWINCGSVGGFRAVRLEQESVVKFQCTPGPGGDLHAFSNVLMKLCNYVVPTKGFQKILVALSEFG